MKKNEMENYSSKNLILNNSDISKKIQRIALQIIEDNFEESEIKLFGISDNGNTIAQKIIKNIEKRSDLKTELIQVILDKGNPTESIDFDKEFDIEGKSIIIIDDVLQSGITMQSVISNLIKHKPKKIKTVVIVNRDQTLFPVKIDFSGISLSTSVDETINLIIEKNGEINFYLS